VNLQKQLTQWIIQQDYVCDFNWAVAYDNYILGEAPVCPDSKLLGRYDNVTYENVIRCAKEIFRKSNMTFTISGPKSKISKEKIRQELDLFED